MQLTEAPLCVQITAANLDLPFAAFAPRGLEPEENDPMVTAVKDVAPEYLIQQRGCWQSGGFGCSGDNFCGFWVQVQPPDSPPCQSPLQASLHSQGSEGSGQQDDFVMVDFVSISSFCITFQQCQKSYLTHLVWHFPSTLCKKKKEAIL